MKQLLSICFVVPVALFSILSCKKETKTTDTRSLLAGKWIGVNKISRITSENPSTKVISYFSDTLFESNTGSDFSIEVKADSLSTIGHYVSSGSSYTDVSIGNTRYSITNDILSFPLNPFTLEGVIDNSFHTSSKILELTNNKLVLYDIDTIQPNPLLVFEAWYNFK